MKKHLLQACLMLICLSSYAQFHTLKIPQVSPHVVETHQLGVTDITVDYSSPAVRGRDVWKDVVPFDGEPIPWRIGANMNTTIEFSTNVTVNGETLPAGRYGLHMIPHRDAAWEVLFLQNDQMWGSYYVDLEKDIFKKLTSEPQVAPFREHLDFEFLNRTDSTVEVTVLWEEKAIPLTVGVDLNKTVIESFRSELLGLNTYRWEAWNDAALWCLNRNTNLEEALAWADRSINGGYNGFSANKNLTNLGTKLKLLATLEKTDEINAVVEDAISVMNEPIPAYYFGQDLLAMGDYQAAQKFYQAALDAHPSLWFLNMGASMADYLSGDKKEAIDRLKSTHKEAEGGPKSRLKGVLDQMEAGTFKL